MSNYNEPNISLRVIWVTLLIYSVVRVMMSVTISAYKLCSVRLFLQLLVRGRICVICVCVHIVVSSTYVFVLFFLLCTICCQFLWMVHLFLPLRYCYACYISICILNRCNHGNDLSEVKITRFFCTIYTIGKYLRI
jgi:phosphatidylserine synthase